MPLTPSQVSSMIGAQRAQAYGPTPAPKPSLDKDQFLQLLVATLRHQDPGNPVDDREFLAQMAQFTALEQMQNLNKTMTALADLQALNEARSFIGARVTVKAPQGYPLPTITATVSQVQKVEGKLKLFLEGQKDPFDFSDVLAVNRPVEQRNPLADANTLAQASVLMGKRVRVLPTADATEPVEGVVTRVLLQGNEVRLVLDNDTTRSYPYALLVSVVSTGGSGN